MSRFIIGALSAGHHGATDQLAAALPLAGETVDILDDTAGAGPWFYAALDEPLKYRTPAGEDQDDAGAFNWITEVVFRAHNPGEQPSFGMRAFPVDLAVVLDPYMRESAVVDLDRIDFIAVVEIDDADHEPPADIPAPDDAADDDVPGPPIIPAAEFDSPPQLQPAADFPQEVEFPAADFPQEVEFPAADFPQEPDVPETEFVSRPDDFNEPPAFPAPRAMPISAEPGPESEFQPEPVEPPPYTPPAPPAAPRRTPALPRSAQVEDLIAQAEATIDRPRPQPASSARTSARPPIAVEPASPRNKGPLVAAGVAAGLLALGVWGFSALQSRSNDSETVEPQASSSTSTASSSSTRSTPTPPPPRPEDFAKVTRVLPPGYPPDTCLPAAATETGGIATLTCGRNADPGGPMTGLYTVFPDRTALNDAFDRAVGASEQLICPGNIQSPGPWRRNATPEKTAGILFCGTRDQKPVIVWSDTERLLLSTVQSTGDGPTLEALYAWWTQHS